MNIDTIISLSNLFWQILGTVFTGVSLYIAIRHSKDNCDK